MSDPRNAAHDKKVAQEKKNQATPETAPDAAAAAPEPAADTASLTPSPELEASLVVLTQLKELEFHSRAHLERLAALQMTVDDELKQKDMVAPLEEVYAAQSSVQTKLTALLEAYKAECDRLQAGRA